MVTHNNHRMLARLTRNSHDKYVLWHKNRTNPGEVTLVSLHSRDSVSIPDVMHWYNDMKHAQYRKSLPSNRDYEQDMILVSSLCSVTH